MHTMPHPKLLGIARPNAQPGQLGGSNLPQRRSSSGAQADVARRDASHLDLGAPRFLRPVSLRATFWPALRPRYFA